ncbi:MAG: alpha-1,6-mannosyltransferase [Sphingobacteriales bacterium]|jgi:alpha-1,6-mannosyltransferase
MQHKVVNRAIALLLIAVIAYLNYAVIRTNFYLLLGCYWSAFILYFVILQHELKQDNKSTIKWLGERVSNSLFFWLSIAFIARAALLFSLPNLSDDFYRFIWDGRASISGINPYDFKPSEILAQNPLLSIELFQNLNSPEYYSVYPPFLQYLFAFATFLFPKSILGSTIVLKLIILGSEVLTLKLLLMLLAKLKIALKNVLWYALNPLVIIELVGNLHFEALMITSVLAAAYFAFEKKWFLSAICMAISVQVKIIPLLFIPLFLPLLGWRRFIKFGLLTGVLIMLVGLPFLNTIERLGHLLLSMELYFNNFSFNGGLYYAVKALLPEAFQVTGLKIYSLITSITVVSIIGYYTFKQKKQSNFFLGMFWALFIYQFCATSIHPWYLVPLLALTPFVKTKIAVIWSILIVVSYFTYRVVPYDEALILGSVSSGIVVIYLLIEKQLKIKY